MKTQDDFERDYKEFLKTETELNKVDIGSAIEGKNVKIDGILDATADLPQPNVKIDDNANVTDVFGDLFENKAMPNEDENFLNDLLTKIADAKKPQTIPEVKYIPVKIEEPKPKYDNVVMKKEPRIHPDDEPLRDLNAYDNWLPKN